jgi:type I restriction-modification system DNA methylase subunit
MARPKSNGSPKDSTATIGFEAKLWLAADKLRNNLDAAGTSGASKTARRGSPQGERGGVHQFGVPPKGNANFAWVQHFIHHLAPQGMAGFVLANGSMSSNESGDCHARSARREWATNSQGLGSQRNIRRALIEADLVDCMVALPA